MENPPEINRVQIIRVRSSSRDPEQVRANPVETRIRTAKRCRWCISRDTRPTTDRQMETWSRILESKLPEEEWPKESWPTTIPVEVDQSERRKVQPLLQLTESSEVIPCK